MRKYILPLALGILALAAAVFGASYWQRHYLAGIAVIQVPVPKSDIQPYTLLTADLFEPRAFPRALAGDGLYAISTSDLDGRISAGVLLASQPVPLRMVPAPQQFRLADPALEVISLPAEATNAVGGEIRLGDEINIYSLQPADPQGETEGGTAISSAPRVVFVARVGVVAALSDNGQSTQGGGSSPSQVSTNSTQRASTGSTQQTQPLKILVVAAPPNTVQVILKAIAQSKLEGATLWITLATP